MEESTSREKILKKLRAALMTKSRMEPGAIDFESNVFQSFEESLELVFAQQFSDVGGQFIFCENDQDFTDNIAALLQDNSFGKVWCGEVELIPLLETAQIKFDRQIPVNDADTTITGCEYLIARTGSIMVSSKQVSGRRAAYVPSNHIVVARTSQLVMHLKDALRELKSKYNDQPPSMTTIITGPSRSADIEKILTTGAHGAKELYLFLIDDLEWNLEA
jgi:L-lactate dehydrogenase complex protein LldG